MNLAKRLGLAAVSRRRGEQGCPAFATGVCRRRARTSQASPRVFCGRLARLEQLEDRRLLTTSVIPGVPAYVNHHGTGPTAAAMVLGYYDMHGFPNLIPGDSSTQTAAVNSIIASTEHYNDYALPLDDPGTGILADKSELGDAHTPNNCLADWTHTSWSYYGNHYGESDTDPLRNGIDAYANSRGYSEFTTGRFTVYFSEDLPELVSRMINHIDQNRPVIVWACPDGNSDAREYVTVVGYDTDTQRYACYNTLDTSIHWYSYIGHHTPYSICGAIWLYPPNASDLAGWDCYVPDELQWGQHFHVVAQVANLATQGVTAPFVQQFYLSNDQVWGDADDVAIGYYIHAGDVPAGQGGGQFLAPVTLPASPPPGYSGGGPFYIGMKTDHLGQVAESDETNNGPGHYGQEYDWDSFTIPLPPPDLSGHDCYVPGLISWGQTFSLQGQVRNLGQTAATATFVQRFYLSNNQVWGDADDLLLGSYSHADDVPAGGTGPDFNVSLTLPASAPTGYSSGGPFYIGMKTDATNAVAESNEANNGPGNTGQGCDWASFFVIPDLAGYDCYVPSELRWGQMFNLQGQVRNLGQGTVTAPFVQRFYLSNDQVWGDADDWSFGAYIHYDDVLGGQLGPDFNVPLTLPASAPPGYSGSGPFYIGMKTDANDSITESNETNNGPGDYGQTYDWDSFTLLLDDNYEQNDTRETAYHLGEQTWLSEISGWGIQRDNDWYEIEVSPEANRVLLDCRNTYAEGDVWMRLYDAAGNLLADSTTPTDNEYIDYTVSPPGTYYVSISGPGTGATYNLWWDGVAPPDDHGDDAASATAAQINTSNAGIIGIAGDEDWFSFPAAEGVSYVFETTLGSLPDSVLHLIATDGTTELAVNDDYSGFASKIEWTAPGTATYYLKVRGYSSYTGTYTLGITAPDDHGGDAAGATVTKVNSSNPGAIQAAGDHDWFRFPAVQDVTYVFETTLGSLYDSVLHLIDTDGTTQITENDDSVGLASRIEWTAPASGNYYLKVRGYGDLRVGTYYLDITEADTTQPARPVVTAPASAKTINADTYLIEGTAEAGSLVRIYVDANNNNLLDAGEALAGQQQLSAFGTGGTVATDIAGNDNIGRGVALQPDGKILLAGCSYSASGYDFALLRYNADGSLDATFGIGGKVTTDLAGLDNVADSIAVQADGKILLGGRSADGMSFGAVLVRYNADGSLDTSFGDGGKITTALGTSGEYAGVAVLGDGKILLGGSTAWSSSADFVLRRYNSDGSIDTGFGSGGAVVTDFGSQDEAWSMTVQADGKILLGGTTWNGSNHDFALARYNANGTLDTTFGTGGKLTTDFGASTDYGYSLAVQGDGKVLFGGLSVNGGQTQFALARYGANGSLDTGFGGGGKLITDFGALTDSTCRGVAVQPDGKILLGGSSVSNGSSHAEFALARYNANDGSLDTSFGTGGKLSTDIGGGYSEASGVAVQADGGILLVGTSLDVSEYDFALVRYNADGSLHAETQFAISVPLTQDAANYFVVTATDAAENVSGVAAVPTITEDSQPPAAPAVSSPASAVTVNADTYLIEGTAEPGSLVRVYVDANNNNQVDVGETLAGEQQLSGGKFTTDFGGANDFALCVAIQADRKIVLGGVSRVSGSQTDLALLRYNLDGSLDTTFGTGGKLTTDFGAEMAGASGIAVQADGKILLGGSVWYGSNSDFALARYEASGTLDMGFGTGGKVTTAFGVGDDGASSVAIQADGKILLGGSASNGSNSDFALARYNANGSLDAGFGIGGKITTDFAGAADYALCAALQADGKVLLGGYTYDGSNHYFALARYDANGSLDTSFGTGGKLTADFGDGYSAASGVAVQDDGKILLGGHAGGDFVLLRYHGDGTPDTSFGTGGGVTADFAGEDDYAYRLALQGDGKILLGGYSYRGLNADFALVRYDADGSLDGTFAAGGKLTTDFDGLTDRGVGLAVQADGKILLAGSSLKGSDWDFALVRYKTDGSLDAETQFAISVPLMQDAVNHFVVTATDAAGNVSAAADVPAITEASQPPVADADGPYWIDTGEALLLDGTGSSDPDTASGDSIVAYRWDLGADGSYEYFGATVSVPWADLASLPQPGVAIPIRLEVEDSVGLKNTADTELKIFDNQPTASFTADPTPVACNQAIAFDASGSYHGRPDRSIVLYEWDWDYDGQTFDVEGTGVTTTHSYARFGDYTAALRVTDDNEPVRTDLATVLVGVSLGNHAPVAHADGPYWVNSGDDLQFNGSKSCDPDAVHGDSIVTYEWDLGGDGSYEYAGVQPLVPWADLATLPQAGEAIPVTLRVTDTLGSQSIDTSELRIFDTAADVVLVGRTVCVRGDDDADTLRFTNSQSAYEVKFNGVSHSYNVADVDAVLFDGGDGQDTVVFNGRDNHGETVEMWPDRATFGGSATVTATGVEAIVANMGSGDGDTVTMHGTDLLDGYDELRAWWYSATFVGKGRAVPGLNMTASGYETLAVHSEAETGDAAFLTDSRGADHWYADPDGSILTWESGSSVETFGFRFTHAYAGDGHDTMELHDSPGDDELLFYKDQVKLNSIAVNGDDHLALYVRRGKYFEEADVHADGGRGPIGDLAYLADGKNVDDVFTADPYVTTMELNVRMEGGQRKVDRKVTVHDFYAALGYSISGGTDTAIFTDSSGNDELDARPNMAKMYPADENPAYDYRLRAKEFEIVEAHSVTGGRDTAILRESSGDDVFTATPEYAQLYGLDVTFNNTVHNFEKVYTFANSFTDDWDVGTLVDSESHKDILEADLALSNPLHWARFFSDASSPLDYWHYLRGLNQVDSEARNAEDDDSGVNPATADWLFRTGW